MDHCECESVRHTHIHTQGHWAPVNAHLHAHTRMQAISQTPRPKQTDAGQSYTTRLSEPGREKKRGGGGIVRRTSLKKTHVLFQKSAVCLAVIGPPTLIT